MKKLILGFIAGLVCMVNIALAAPNDILPATHRDSNNEIVLDRYDHTKCVILENGVVVCDNTYTLKYNPSRSYKFIVYKLSYDASFVFFKDFMILPILVEIPANTAMDKRVRVAFADPQSTGLPASSQQVMKLYDFTTKDIKFAPLKPINEFKNHSDFDYCVWTAIAYIQNK